MPSKKRKAREIGQQCTKIITKEHAVASTNEAEVTESCRNRCLEISDELWMQIIRFLYGEGLGMTSMRGMFHDFILVSKSFQLLCSKYVQQIPQSFVAYDDDETMHFIAYSSRNYAKLSSFKAMGPDGTSSWIIAVVYLFKKCNLCELDSLDLMYITKSIKMRHTNRSRFFSIMTELSYSDMMRQIDDYHYLHSSLANLFHEKHPPLRKLSLTIRYDKWSYPLLEVVSDTIEELTLVVRGPYLEDSFIDDEISMSGPDPRFQQYFCHLIEQMPRLKKLNLTLSFPCKILIRSASLEEFYLDAFGNYSFIEKCTCPSLKILKVICNFYVSDASDRIKFEFCALQPLPRICKDDSNIKHGEDKGAKCLDVMVRDMAFGVLEVPEVCIVRFLKEMHI